MTPRDVKLTLTQIKSEHLNSLFPRASGFSSIQRTANVPAVAAVVAAVEAQQLQCAVGALPYFEGKD